MAKKSNGVNPDLEKFVNQLMQDTMSDESASITDKVKVLDRALKLEAIKAKFSDADFGAAFFTDDDDEEK